MNSPSSEASSSRDVAAANSTDAYVYKVCQAFCDLNPHSEMAGRMHEGVYVRLPNVILLEASAAHGCQICRIMLKILIEGSFDYP